MNHETNGQPALGCSCGRHASQSVQQFSRSYPTGTRPDTMERKEACIARLRHTGATVHMTMNPLGCWEPTVERDDPSQHRTVR